MSLKSGKNYSDSPSECFKDYNILTSPATLDECSDPELKKRQYSIESIHHLGIHDLKPTTSFDTLSHMIKGNVGCGILAMGMAFKNGGIVFSVVLLLFLGLISCYNQHVLVIIADEVKRKNNLQYVSLNETIGVAFEEGSSFFKKSAEFAKWLIKAAIILTQFGFSCAYFLFISQSLEQVCACYGVKVNVHVLMLHVLPVISVIALIRELKYIAPLSTLANLSAFAALSLIMYNSVTGLGPISDRNFMGKWDEIPLSFGTMVFALEGITITLPLQQNMKKKEQFLGTCGVLNLSLMFVLALTEVVGFFGYYKFGSDVKESLTLNLGTKDDVIAQVVIVLMMLGILSSYALQFFMLVLQFLPDVQKKTATWPYSSWHLYEYLLRFFLTFLAFLAAQLVPHLDLVVSLVGSIGGTFLAFLFAPLADIAHRKRDQYGFLSWRLIVAIISIIIAVLGSAVGTVVSIKEIIIAIQADLSA